MSIANASRPTIYVATWTYAGPDKEAGLSESIAHAVAASHESGHNDCARLSRRCEYCPDWRHGRPRVPGSNIQWSIARSVDGVFMALSNARVGIDAEVISNNIGDQMPYARVLAGVPTRLENDVVWEQAWTRLEAIGKATGLGLALDLGSLTVKADGSRADYDSRSFSLLYPWGMERYSVTIAVEGSSRFTRLKVFSLAKSPGCHRLVRWVDALSASHS
jgi:hypothetical protein